MCKRDAGLLAAGVMTAAASVSTSVEDKKNEERTEKGEEGEKSEELKF